jgi:uncharacterized protein YjbI with pentapeptide repeats
MKSQEINLENSLHAHSIWVLSQGTRGELANFDGWNLDGADLVSADLPFARFQSASLKGAFLSGANLRQAKLVRVNLNRARLDGADLEGANISGGDLSFAECNGANFTEANLKEINFQSANLEEASFIGANLRRADFKNAVLKHAEFDGADLEGANLDGAKILGTDFAEVYLEDSNLDIANFKEAHLKGSNSEKTDSSDPKFEVTDFSDRIDLILNESKFKDFRPSNHDIEKTTANRMANIEATKGDLFVDSNAVNAGIIEKAESDLIAKIKSSIDLDQVKLICKHQHSIGTIDKIDFEKGQIVTHKNRVAFKLDFKIGYKLSLLLDRKGNWIIDFPEDLKKPRTLDDNFKATSEQNSPDLF